jgi:hypothetical protein
MTNNLDEKWNMIPTGVNLCFVTKTRFSHLLCTTFFDRVFVFGDNEARTGSKGQAVIRFESNTFGLRTKRLPCTQTRCYWFDDTFQMNCAVIDEDIAKLNSILSRNVPLVFSSNGYGNGLAKLNVNAPNTYQYLNNQLRLNFGLQF